MAERGTIQAKLNAGIDAARAGDQAAARQLLRQVLTADPENEVAWMWMASAVTTVEERKACLERALKINPNNTRAREALRRLETTPDVNPRDAIDLRETEQRRARRIEQAGQRRGISPYFILAGVALLFVIIAVALALSSQNGTPGSGGNTPQPTLREVANQDGNTVARFPTRLPGVIVTLDPNEFTPLPPTFTPTFTPTATEPPPPTATAIPLSTYTLLFSLTDSSSRLYTIRADGTRQLERQSDANGFADIAVDPGGQRIAFVREVGGDGQRRPQLFVAQTSDLNTAVQITDLDGETLTHPSWSPDGAQIAFASDDDGDLDVYVIPAAGGQPTRLTGNSGVDTDPAWSPDGALIAYASDQNTPAFGNYPGSPEIYTMSPDGTGATQLTNDTGDSVDPAWSPDGSRIAFVSNRGGDNDMYVMDRDGSGENLITFDDSGAEDRNPVFTPDGRWIAFVSNREAPAFQAYLADPTGQQVVRVTADNRDIQSLAMIRDESS